MTDYSEILKQERNVDWRVELRNSIPNKERTNIERVKMNEVSPNERIKSQTCEVNKGLT
ncbi:MAG: dihydropyrimidine dehydrogenase, partial [Erysipelotrichia bacterium]|nr:dihydropyrimidine dehydrogenase [Erysipelotrichia bacterium]